MAAERCYVKRFSVSLQINVFLFLFFSSQIVGFAIGVISPIHNLMVGSNAPLHVVEDSASMLGYASPIHNLTETFISIYTGKDQITPV